ncbi:hypothetical protein [Pontibacter sp. HSC-36F09]|uniref:hypothetical protein n=1 Tax=Pontibacter sp. HSC-36F09 TaxID=2910966 RepID=UPI00209F7CEF|nr:hypothetical protein [Pontibacter sp. HSC-36F09]MCP2045415.1 hypothetical protein [Pontibacter sp. HSC-36F09]
MNRRDRDRYDHDNYDRNYSGSAGYDRNDEHYHSARNLTNEFEQEYRSHHRDRDDDRYNRNSGNIRHSYHEGNMGDAYERMREGSGTTRRDSDYNMNYGQRDRGNWGESRNRNQNWSDADRYGSSDRYSQRSNEFDRDRDMRSREHYSNQDRSRHMGQRGQMSQDRMREGYGISDYGRMGQSDIHSNRGVPNAGITSSFEDDYGPDLDSSRSNRISSGNYGGYGSQGGGYSRNRDDRY